jgi:hypothetical protein
MTMPGQPLGQQGALQTKPSRRTDEEVDELMNMAAESADSGVSAYPGKTYEAGIAAACEWVFGFTNEHPLTGGS